MTSEKVKDTKDSDGLYHYPKVGFFKLQFEFADCTDVTQFTLAMIGAIGMGVCFPLMSLTLGDSISNFVSVSPENIVDLVSTLCLTFVYLGIGMFFAAFLNVTFSTLNQKRYVTKLKLEYFRSLLRQEQGFYDSRNVFEYGTKIQSQMKIIQNGLGTKVSATFQAFSTFIVSYVVGFVTSWKLGLILLTVVPIIGIAGYCLVKGVVSSQEKTRQYFEQASGIAEEVLYQIKTVASFSNFEYERERFNEKINFSYEKGKKEGVTSALSRAIVFFLIFGSFGLSMGVGAMFIADKEPTNRGKLFNVGDVLIMIFTIVVGGYFLGSAIPHIKAITAACEASREFFYIRERVPQIDLSESVLKPKIKDIYGKIEFKEINFAYPSKPERIILKDFNMHFEAGTSNAIVGETGSGKSTIVNLLERLYDAQTGAVEVDGINIKKINLEYFRSLIGYVPQEPVLFNSSIKDNIIFGRKNVTDEEVLEACEKACVKEFLHNLDKGLDTKVGVKGSKLSGGQKQRVAIARAILKKPKILILDEATSALDYKNEILVKKALEIVSKDVTTIIIAHRLSTVRNANKIVVLNQGNIAEVGTHDELFKLGGLYYNLVKSQEEVKIEEDPVENKRDEVEEVLDADNKYESEARLKSSNKHSSLKEEELPKVEVIEDLTLEERKKRLQEEEKRNEEIVKRAKKMLIPIICEQPCLIIGATIFATLSGVAWPLFGFVQAEGIFRLAAKDEQDLRDNGKFMGGMFVLLAGISGIAYFFVGFIFNMVGELLALKMRKKCFAKYLELHIGFFEDQAHNPGALLTKLSTDTIKINGIALSMIAVIVETVVTLIVGIAISFAYSWQLSLLCIGFIPIIIVSYSLRALLQKGLETLDELKEKDVGNLLSECLVNTKTIYAFNMQNHAVQLLEDILKEGESSIKSLILVGIFVGFTQCIMYMVYAVNFYVGAILINKGYIRFDDMFRAMFTILYSASGVGIMEGFLGDMKEAKKSLISLFTLLSTESTINPSDKENKVIATYDTLKGDIEFKNVCFSYPTRKNHKLFNNLNFKISDGDSAAFVGFSGSGKSTIIQLLLRFYDADSGEVLINGINIKDYDLVSLRHLFGLVMQEPSLFKTNVYTNILYGNLKASEAEVKESAIRAKVPRIELITKENKDDIPVSGGEKQRIAIARCILRNPKILLLDEATSALDKNVEEEVQKSLDELMKDRTSIVVAHRLSTIVNCTKIFFVESGQIKEEGNHEELLKLNGKYASLYFSGSK